VLGRGNPAVDKHGTGDSEARSTRVGPSYWVPVISGNNKATTFTIPSLAGATITGMTYDGRYLWVAAQVSGDYSMTIIDPTTMTCVAQNAFRVYGPNPLVPVCWGGTNIWSSSPAVASGNPNLFVIDPDLFSEGGFGDGVGDFSNLNEPKALVSRVTPSGARVYAVCGDNTVQLIVAEPYVA
jgi:hypothetical protein